MANYRMYSIPERFRRFENLHIIFWLIKDLSWAMLWKPIGLLMFLPTFTLAIVITWQTRKLKSEFFHNLAVVFWITANGYWMIVEFLEAPDHYRYFTAIPFSIGIICIAWYYVFVRPSEKNAKTVVINVEVAEDTLKLVSM